MSLDKDRVRDVVKQVVDEALGSAVRRDDGASRESSGWKKYDDAPNFRGRELITESDVAAARRDGRPLVLSPGAMVTPAARDAIERWGMKVEESTGNEKSVEAIQRVAAAAAPAPAKEAPLQKPAEKAPGVAPILPAPTGSEVCKKGVVVIASDHGGFDTKKMLVEFLQKEAGIPCLDLGTHSTDAVDYPDFAKKVADAVASGQSCRGIVIDGAGIGSSMAANKVKGIRAAHCSNVVEARNAREHNDANVLCLGGRIIGPEMAKAITIVFLKTDFAGGRHLGRVQKIMGLEK